MIEKKKMMPILLAYTDYLSNKSISDITTSTVRIIDNFIDLYNDEPTGEDHRKSLTIDDIIRIVCHYFFMSRENLLRKTNKRDIVEARQFAMYLADKYCIGNGLDKIGKSIGGKDHSTVIHSRKKIENLIETHQFSVLKPTMRMDEVACELYARIEKKIKQYDEKAGN